MKLIKLMKCGEYKNGNKIFWIEKYSSIEGNYIETNSRGVL